MTFRTLQINERYSIVIGGICAITMVWAVCLLRDPLVTTITGIHSLAELAGGSITLSLWLVLACALSVVGMSTYQRHRWCIALLLPQQIMLLIAAAGQVNSMIIGQFADGTVRTSDFLMADQCPMVVMAVCHIVAMLKMAQYTQR